jgi:hypothetical protein
MLFHCTRLVAGNLTRPVFYREWIAVSLTHSKSGAAVNAEIS